MKTTSIPSPAEILTAKAYHDKLVEYHEEYKDYLLLVKSDGTSVSHGDIVHQFINYLFNQHLITDFSQITVRMVRSGFYNCFKKMNEEQISKEEMRKVLKGFFDVSIRGTASC